MTAADAEVLAVDEGLLAVLLGGAGFSAVHNQLRQEYDLPLRESIAGVNRTRCLEAPRLPKTVAAPGSWADYGNARKCLSWVMPAIRATDLEVSEGTRRLKLVKDLKTIRSALLTNGAQALREGTFEFHMGKHSGKLKGSLASVALSKLSIRRIDTAAVREGTSVWLARFVLGSPDVKTDFLCCPTSERMQTLLRGVL